MGYREDLEAHAKAKGWSPPAPVINLPTTEIVGDANDAPPTGVSPDIWRSLSPAGKVAASQRQAQAVAPRPAPEAPEKTFVEKGIDLMKHPPILEWAMGKNDPKYSENGGHLVPLNEPASDTVKAPVGAPADVKPGVPGDLVSKPGAGQGDGEPAMPVAHPVNVAAQNVDMVDPKLQAEMHGAFGQQTDALTRGGEAIKKVAEGEAGEKEVEAEGARAESRAFGRQASDTKTAAKEDEDFSTQRLAEINRAHDEQMKKTPDPGRYWASRDTFSKTMFTIADILGAFNQRSNGGHNTAHERLQELASQDLDKQKAEYDAAGDKAKGLESNYAQAMKAKGDKREKEAIAMGLQMKGLNAAAKSMAAGAASPTIMAKAEGFIAQNDYNIGKVTAESVGEDIREHKYVPAHQVMAGGVPGGMMSDIKPDEVVRLPDGKQVSVPKEDREKVLGHIHTFQALQNAESEYKRLVDVPLYKRGPEWQNSFDAIAKIVTAPEIQEGGKGGKGIFDAFMAPVARKAVIFTPGAKNAFDTIKKSVEGKMHNALDSSAQHEVTETMQPNTKTNRLERGYIIQRPYKRSVQAPPAADRGAVPVGPTE